MIADLIKRSLPISERSIQLIESLISIEPIRKGEMFISEGQFNKSEYFILSGIVHSFLLSPEGEKITIDFFEGPAVLSPFVIRSKNDRATLNFETLTYTTLGAMDAKLFEQLMVENLEIREFANSVLKQELSNKVNKEIAMASLTAKDRLILFREIYGGLENKVPHSTISSYLGITTISLSRLRGDFP